MYKQNLDPKKFFFFLSVAFNFLAVGKFLKKVFLTKLPKEELGYFYVFSFSSLKISHIFKGLERIRTEDNTTLKLL